jgi:hypothetical protein
MRVVLCPLRWQVFVQQISIYGRKFKPRSISLVFSVALLPIGDHINVPSSSCIEAMAYAVKFPLLA